jgi:hypothetical protein
MKVQLKEFDYFQNEYCRTLNNFNMRAFRHTSDVRAVLNFPPSVLQHLRCNYFDRSNNSGLQFIVGGHRGLANNVLNVP